MKLVKNRGPIEGGIRQAFGRSMEEVAGQADRNAPVDEGALHASINWNWINQTGDHLRARVGSALRYAAIRELGGTIRPVRARRLMWRSHDGKFHSANVVVQAPGGKKGSSKHGKPYLKPAVDKFGDYMGRNLKRMT